MDYVGAVTDEIALEGLDGMVKLLLRDYGAWKSTSTEGLWWGRYNRLSWADRLSWSIARYKRLIQFGWSTDSADLADL